MDAVNAALAAAILNQAPGLLHLSLEMECDELAPRAARAFTRKALANWGLPEELADRAVLIVSELATNAFKHARTKPAGESETISLTLCLLPGVVLGIRMIDNCCAPPIPRIVGYCSQSGRGLRLVASESDAWAYAPRPGRRGKEISVFLRCPAVHPAA